MGCAALRWRKNQLKLELQTFQNVSILLLTCLKERIEKAAIVSGLTVTDFAINTLATTADEVLEKHQTRKLSNRDRDIFLEMLENPPKPDKALLKAVRKFNARVKE